ncbi:MAG TPA: hypothetical protein VGZ69_04935 [Candidatus Rhabdochlamydia sp.]|jgi:hypothetical protein|nr:hypothetical protein [Candidatus Rhabdochlamydia sp.]
MKKQKIFILITSLVTSYASLEAVSQKEMLIARLDAKAQSIHIQELAKKQEIEDQKQYEAKKAEEQRIAAQEKRKADRLKKQEIQEQRNLIRKLETDEDADSILVSEEG